MNHHYFDIRSRIAEPPTWFDEHGVPRYCEFAPKECSNIYAREVALVRIACQGCGNGFQVCLSAGLGDVLLSKLVETRELHYGDPPNIDCCAAGPSMNSIPQRVLQFWRAAEFSWHRVPELEVDITPDWAES